MKLFDYHHVYDYGHEWYLNVLCTRFFNLLQFNVDWSYYASRPLFLMNILGESLIGFNFSIYKLTISFDLLAYQPRKLSWYRE